MISGQDDYTTKISWKIQQKRSHKHPKSTGKPGKEPKKGLVETKGSELKKESANLVRLCFLLNFVKAPAANPPALPACLVKWGLMTDCLSVLCFCLYSLS